MIPFDELICFSEGVGTQPPSRLIDVKKPVVFFFRSENPYLWSKQVYLLNHLRNDPILKNGYTE